jgi:hypothetical protein
LPQFFADRFGWKELAGQVAGAVRSLPTEDRARCLIVADNYGEAAAINYYGRRYGIRAASQHNSHYLWGYGRNHPRCSSSWGKPGESRAGIQRSERGRAHQRAPRDAG